MTPNQAEAIKTHVPPRLQTRHLVLLASLIALAFLETTWLSIARYQAYNVRAFDLGIMSQAIWNASQGQPLVFTIEGIPLSRLARHVEFFYFFLAALYKMWPTPQTLLVAQSLLYAVGAIPLFFLAYRRLKSVSLAMIITIIYLFYPVAQTAVLFDLHGDTLAMPLLLFVLEALDRKAWRSFVIWIGLALSCKFYVAGLVTALGGLIWLRGERRTGLITVMAGLGWGILTFWVIRPLFAPPEAALLQATSTSYLNHYFGDLQAIRQTMTVRIIIGLIVYLPALIIGWRAPIWLALAGVIVAPTVLSTGPGPSFDYRYHHYALAVPFLLMAIVYGLENIVQRQGQPKSY